VHTLRGASVCKWKGGARTLQGVAEGGMCTLLGEAGTLQSLCSSLYAFACAAWGLPCAAPAEAALVRGTLQLPPAMAVDARRQDCKRSVLCRGQPLRWPGRAGCWSGPAPRVWGRHAEATGDLITILWQWVAQSTSRDGATLKIWGSDDPPIVSAMRDSRHEAVQHKAPEACAGVV